MTAHLGRNLVAGFVVGVVALLSATVADGMGNTRHDSNQELIGQGIANIAAPLFGGFAATGAIARTATHIRNGATSPIAGVVHCAFLLLVILQLAPLAAHIPLAALAAILFHVEYLEKTLRRSQNRVRTVVIRMGRVPFMDTTGLSALAEIVADFQRIGTRVVLCEVGANVLEKLERARILARVGPSGVYRTLSEFLDTHKLDAGREI